MMNDNDCHVWEILIQLDQQVEGIIRPIVSKSQQCVNEQDIYRLPTMSFIVADVIENRNKIVIMRGRRVINLFASHITLDEIGIVFADIAGKIPAMFINAGSAIRIKYKIGNLVAISACRCTPCPATIFDERDIATRNPRAQGCSETTLAHAGRAYYQSRSPADNIRTKYHLICWTFFFAWC